MSRFFSDGADGWPPSSGVTVTLPVRRSCADRQSVALTSPAAPRSAIFHGAGSVAGIVTVSVELATGPPTETVSGSNRALSPASAAGGVSESRTEPL